MYMQHVTEYDVTNISGTQPRKNMITIGKVDTFELMMIVIWAMGISIQSPVEHTTPYLVLTMKGNRQD